MGGERGYASSDPRKARHVKNPLLVRIFVAHHRRQARRLPGLTTAERQELLAALARHKAN
jgi:hypothetical protein